MIHERLIYQVGEKGGLFAGAIHYKVHDQICAGTHSSRFSGAYCPALARRSPRRLAEESASVYASYRPESFRDDNDKRCRLRANGGFLDNWVIQPCCHSTLPLRYSKAVMNNPYNGNPGLCPMIAD